MTPELREAQDRFLAGGNHAISDREHLALLLRRPASASDLARELVDLHGTFADAVAAPEVVYRRMGIKRDIALNLRLIAAVPQRVLRAAVMRKPILATLRDVIKYCHATLDFETVEQFRILFLNHQGCLIADELHQRGTIAFVPAYPREVVRRTIELSASSVILIHNHPTRSIRSRWSTHKHAETLANSGIFGIA